MDTINELDCRDIATQGSILVERTLCISCQPNTVLCDRGQSTELLRSSFTVLIECRDLIEHVHHRNVEGLVVRRRLVERVGGIG